MKKKLVACAIVFLVVPRTFAYVESDAHDNKYVIAQMKSGQSPCCAALSPSEVAELRRNLRSSDENLQISAMQTALSSGTRAVREIAFDEGFSSDRPVLRSMALIGRVSDSPVLVVELTRAPNTSAEKWKSIAQEVGGEQWSFDIEKVDPSNGAIKFHTLSGPGTGRVAGQTLTLVTPHVRVTLTLEKNGEMVGTATHGRGGPFSARLRLQ